MRKLQDITLKKLINCHKKMSSILCFESKLNQINNNNKKEISDYKT
jgi:hypothetical protein